MDENKFFKFIWRFNGLVLMGSGILAMGILAFAGYKIISDEARERNPRNIVNVQAGNDVQQKWQLGYMSQIQGSPYVMIPLNSDQSDSQSYSSKSSSLVRNYLFIDSKNNRKHWLFNTNQYLIADSDFLSVEENGADDGKVLAILYKIVKSDTNKDNRLTDSDFQSIGLSLPSGEGYREILDGIDFFLGHRLIDHDTLLIVFQRGGIGYPANVSLSEFAISNEEELPKISP